MISWKSQLWPSDFEPRIDYSPEDRLVQQRDHEMKMTELTFRSEGVLQQIRQIEVIIFQNARLFIKVFRLNWLFKKNVKIFIELLHSVLIILYPIGHWFRYVILYYLSCSIHICLIQTRNNIQKFPREFHLFVWYCFYSLWAMDHIFGALRERLFVNLI